MPLLLNLNLLFIKTSLCFSQHYNLLTNTKFLTISAKPKSEIMLGAAKQKHQKTSYDRDVALSQLEKDKKWSFIKAWEESEKTKADNKAQRELSAIAAWENNKTAALEAKLKKTEEHLEKKKAEYAEKKKNKTAMIHKQAEEKRALVVVRRGEEILKAEEMSAKFRATGQIPKKLIGCF